MYDECNRMTYIYRPMSIVHLVPDDDTDPFKGFLGPEPRRHAGVDDHGDIAILVVFHSKGTLTI